MAKISSYVDGGNPQDTDEFVVARTGLNLKVTWANIVVAMSALFAGIATGVTNGDTHDHSGGDGGTISHLSLSNIGSSNHAAIDAHVLGARWTSVPKTADETIQSDTALSTDTHLVSTFSANKTYAFRGRIFFETTAAADFKFRFVCSGALFYVKYTWYPAGSTTGTVVVDTASPGTTVAATGAGTVGGYIEFDGIAVIDGSDRAWGFQWAQNTSTAANTTVKAGSYLQYIKVD